MKRVAMPVVLNQVWRCLAISPPPLSQRRRRGGPCNATALSTLPPPRGCPSCDSARCRGCSDCIHLRGSKTYRCAMLRDIKDHADAPDIVDAVGHATSSAPAQRNNTCRPVHCPAFTTLAAARRFCVGLAIFFIHLFEHLDMQRLIGDESLQPGVLVEPAVAAVHSTPSRHTGSSSDGRWRD